MSRVTEIGQLSSGQVTPALATPTVVYSQLSQVGFAANSSISPDALDDVTLSGTAVAGPRLKGLTFAVGVAPGTTAQTGVVFVDFYDTVNPASTGAVESNYLGGFGGTLTITANAGTTTALRAFTFSALETLSTPINFNDDNIGVEISFANAAGTAYSTILTPITSVPGVPTVGASLTGVYRDAGLNDFQATDFDPAAGNLYLSMSTISVPEPTSLIALVGAGLVAFRRRRA